MKLRLLFLTSMLVLPDIAMAQPPAPTRPGPAVRPAPVKPPQVERPNPGPGANRSRPPGSGGPSIQPVRPGRPGGPGGPGVQPPHPGRPGGPGGPAIQPPRPDPGQGVRPPRPPRPGDGHRPPPRPGDGHRPPPGGGWHRPPSWGNGGRPPNFRPINRPGWQYPPGYRYRRWSIGFLLPGLFLSSSYYFDDWNRYGLPRPPMGYRWVRYGPDLLLVWVATGRIEDVIYGAFY